MPDYRELAKQIEQVKALLPSILEGIQAFEKDIKNLSKNDIYQMPEYELRQYAASKGLSEVVIETLVLKVIYHYKNVEIQQERGYSKSAINYHLKIIKEKLN